MRPVPGHYGFPRYADDVLPVAVPEGAVPAFPFWKYVTLSVTAGVISHFIIRILSSKGKK